MTDTVKIKITPNAVSANTDDQPNVVKLSFANNGIKPSQPLFVNGRNMIAQSQFLQFNELRASRGRNRFMSRVSSWSMVRSHWCRATILRWMQVEASSCEISK